MNLKSLFKPITGLEYKPEIGGLKVFDYLYVHDHEFPELEGVDMVIFSVGDSDEFSTLIRKELFELYCGYARQKVADLGFISPGVSFDDTCRRIKDLCETFYQRQIIPIVLGDNHAYGLGLFYGFENLNKDINIVNVDSVIDLKETESPEDSHIKTMLLHQPNYIRNFSQLGFQSYLNPPEYQETLEQLSFDQVRLGKMVEDIREMEPYFRMADLVSLDLSVIKSSDLQGDQAFPFGISSEQACQLAWYAGLSTNCNSLGIFYNNHQQTPVAAKLLAVMVWYFMEGYSERDMNTNFQEDPFRKYIVEEGFEPMVFYKNKINNQWWIEIPVGQQQKVIPCSYNDYLSAVNGEIPKVYLKGIEKYH